MLPDHSNTIHFILIHVGTRHYRQPKRNPSPHGYFHDYASNPNANAQPNCVPTPRLSKVNLLLTPLHSHHTTPSQYNSLKPLIVTIDSHMTQLNGNMPIMILSSPSPRAWLECPSSIIITTCIRGTIHQFSIALHKDMDTPQRKVKQLMETISLNTNSYLI